MRHVKLFCIRKDVLQMVHNNKRYSEEFKKQIVNLHLSGKSVKALANEYGLSSEQFTNGRSSMLLLFK